MILETRAAPPFMKNGYLLACPRTREAAIIDPGDEVGAILDAVRELAVTVVHILLTHAHLDHINGVSTAKATCGAPVRLHKDDVFLYERIVQQGQMFGLSLEPQVSVDAFYADGDEVTFGDYVVRVHHTPGHCPGEVCLQVGERGQPGTHLFVGDSLFAGSIGRTDLPGGDYQTLMRSITEVIFPLGDDAVVHPGHGPDTTVGRERRSNPFVLDYLATRCIDPGEEP